MLRSVPWYLAALALLGAGIVAATAIHPAAGAVIALLAASPLAVAVGARFAALEHRGETD